jgi:hypothetical protein
MATRPSKSTRTPPSRRKKVKKRIKPARSKKVKKSLKKSGVVKGARKLASASGPPLTKPTRAKVKKRTVDPLPGGDPFDL